MVSLAKDSIDQNICKGIWPVEKAIRQCKMMHLEQAFTRWLQRRFGRKRACGEGVKSV